MGGRNRVPAEPALAVDRVPVIPARIGGAGIPGCASLPTRRAAGRRHPLIAPGREPSRRARRRTSSAPRALPLMRMSGAQPARGGTGL
jgi:hypothetical protein